MLEFPHYSMAPGSGDSEGGKDVPSVGTSITILKASGDSVPGNIPTFQ